MNVAETLVLEAMTRPMPRESIEAATGFSALQVALSLEILEAMGKARHYHRDGSLVILFERVVAL